MDNMSADGIPQDGGGNRSHGNGHDGDENHAGGGRRTPAKMTSKDIMIKGSIIGAVVTVPSLVVFVIAWIILDDIMIGAISAVIVHFVSMGFSFKLARRLMGTAGAPAGQEGSRPGAGGR